ncbi:unnamed protein product, partial [Heterotrigona itama]
YDVSAKPVLADIMIQKPDRNANELQRFFPIACTYKFYRRIDKQIGAQATPTSSVRKSILNEIVTRSLATNDGSSTPSGKQGIITREE